MKKTRALHLLLFLMLINHMSAYNILGIFLFPARSTTTTFKQMIKELTEKQHKVTIITNFALHGIEKNYQEILLGGEKYASEIQSLSNLTEITHGRLTHYARAHTFASFTEKLCSLLFKQQDILNLKRSNTKFDLVMVQISHSECVYQIAKLFKCPVIAVHSTLVMPWSTDRFALTNNPAYIPNPFVPFSDKMDFLERLDNTLITLYHFMYYNYGMLAKDGKVIREHYGETEALKLNDYKYDTCIYLVNTHYTLNLPRPLVPNVVEVGGVHIGKEEHLPQVSFSQGCDFVSFKL